MRNTSTTVTAEHGVPFTAVYVPAGGAYGATDSLIAIVDLVEFYDARYALVNDFGEAGQFVNRYNADTMLGRDSWRSATGGINLNGGVPDWEIDAATMTEVRDWLTAVVDA